MPYPHEHMLFAWQGSILAPGNAAVADFAGSMRFATESSAASGAAIALADNDDTMEAVLADLRSFWGSTSGRIPTTFRINRVKWNRIGTDGRYVDRDNTREMDGVNLSGASASQYPHYVAAVSTWRTSASRGVASKGRTYWPTALPTRNGGGSMELTTIDAFAQACASLIDEWGNWPGPDLTPLKPVVGSPLREGRFRYITSVDVGDELDVQTRRKHTPETYRNALVGG